MGRVAVMAGLVIHMMSVIFRCEETATAMAAA
jgi:hypothetical protein